MAKKLTTAEKKDMGVQLITDNALGSFLNYMPNPDSIDFGSRSSYDLYREMRTDPRIKSLLNKLKTTSLNFSSAVIQSDGCSDEVFSFIENLEFFKNSFYKKAKRMLSALDYGFSISEVVWKNENGSWIPDNIITRKPERFSFDSQWNCYCTNAGLKQPLDQRYKWLIYQHDPDDENPYGTSVLRCCYWAYMFKKAGYDFWLMATEKFSVKTVLALFNAEGDEEKLKEKARTIADSLREFISGSGAALANVTDVKEIGAAGDLIGFRELTDACDVQICYGLTGQSVATQTADGGSYALGKVGSDLFYEDAKGVALEIQAIIQKVINWTVELNFAQNMAAPIFEFDIKLRASFADVMSAIDRNIPVSKKALYTTYGLPEPRDEDDTFIKPVSQIMPDELNLSDSGSKSKKKVQPIRRVIRVV